MPEERSSAPRPAPTTLLFSATQEESPAGICEGQWLAPAGWPGRAQARCRQPTKDWRVWCIRCRCTPATLISTRQGRGRGEVSRVWLFRFLAPRDCARKWESAHEQAVAIL